MSPQIPIPKTYDIPCARGLIKIRLLDSPVPRNKANPRGPKKRDLAPPPQNKDGPPRHGVPTFDLDTLGTADSILMLTNGPSDNQWLRWIIASARGVGMEDCVACAAARPLLVSTPVSMDPATDVVGSRCAIALFMKKDPANCATLSSVFPPGLNNSAAPAFKIGGSNYTCLQRDRDETGNSKSVGKLAQNLCTTIINATGTLLLTLPPTWNGRCTLARLVVPITMVRPKEIAEIATKEGRKNAGSEWDAADRDTWIDSIGVPRGVPEFKLVDQIAAGFENLPLISALFPVTPNKNIDRINYIHYNVQKLSNRTRDAVTGLSEQLAATTLMAFQNRLALDMLLAEKGGVCAMFGDQCCTFIPNNTAPDGSVTKALAGLRALSNLMAEDSGVENPLEEWFTGMFGKWKTKKQGLVCIHDVTVYVCRRILCHFDHMRVLWHTLHACANCKTNQSSPNR
ncbi:Endogenous retrovirus group V member 1 Env polyprotein [Merluccius polli]|uniref:Endogenous retrovirus group V member 1 Env polyprotein n=1 Tax=Merluccius polli TaxID=89951 RepID=A0AA47MB98_MERPO|nr:Endogenous retrovirus group V member 1 Env polyprotein [Merluccius polli]